jgi:predicted RNA-binding Zn ribbon-like protein
MRPPLFGLTAPTPVPHYWEGAPSLDLINSLWTDHLGSGKSYDRLIEPRFRRAFFKRWHFRVADPDDSKALTGLARLRAMVRDALERYMDGRQLPAGLRLELEAIVNRAPLLLRVDRAGGGTLLHPQRTGRDWDIVMAEIATSAVRLMSERRLIKTCANPDCSWMFVDESKPGTRRWCNPGVCGSLINVRRYRNTHASKPRQRTT